MGPLWSRRQGHRPRNHPRDHPGATPDPRRPIWDQRDGSVCPTDRQKVYSPRRSHSARSTPSKASLSNWLRAFRAIRRCFLIAALFFTLSVSGTPVVYQREQHHSSTLHRTTGSSHRTTSSSHRTTSSSRRTTAVHTELLVVHDELPQFTPNYERATYRRMSSSPQP